MLTPQVLRDALSARYRDLVGRRDFLPSVLVVEGLAPKCTAGHLRELFAEFGQVKRSCIIGDSIGGRAGVVVFLSAASCSAAAKAEPASPLYSRVLQATALGRRNARRCYGHLMNLIGVLYAISPAVIEDPFFLDRSVLLEGVARTIAPRDLLIDFGAQEAVLVRDTEFGDRVGLMVLRDASQCARVLAAGPVRGSYCSCILARSANFTRLQILDALDARARQQPTADVIQSLIPPQYLLTDSQRDLHFRCVFLRGPGISDAGASSLFCTVTEELLPMGFVSAVIIRRDDNIAVFICDNALPTEAAYMRVPRLLKARLGMYESSLFPVPPGDTSGELLLPSFLMAAEYTDRVLLLTGLNSEACDAAEVAQFLEVVLELKKVEAVLVYGGGAVVVAVHITEDANVLLELPQETWFDTFARDVQCKRFPTPPTRQMSMVSAGLDLRFNFWNMINPMAYEGVRLRFNKYLDDCPNDNLRGLVRGLSGLAAISQPHDGLLRSNFTDRAVLLMGTGIHRDTSEPALRHVLSRYGSLDGLVLYGEGRVAMVIFRSWIAAARLLREPDATLMLVGIHCHPAPDAGFAGYNVSKIIEHALELHAITPPFG